MSWMKLIIDRDPNTAIIVPDDPGKIQRPDPGTQSTHSLEELVPPASPPEADAVPCSDNHASTDKSILIVEDERIFAEDLKETLLSLGYNVDGIISTGVRAVNYMKTAHPDLILLDINLGEGMNGIEAAEKILLHTSIPIIYLTGYADLSLIERAKATSPYGYVLKPFNIRELQSAIEIAFYKHNHDLQLKKAYGELEQRVAERTLELGRINRALEKSERRYRTLFEGVPIGLYRTTPSGQILDINPALVHLLGYPNREMLMTVSVSDLYMDAEDRNQWLALIEREGIVRDFEMQFRKYDGTIIWVRDTGKVVRNDSGQVVYYNGNLEDITGRKQVEESLKLKDFAIISSINAIAIADISGNLTYVNPAFLSIWGYEDPQEVLGRPVVSFWMVPEEAQQVVDGLLVRGNWSGELIGQRKDGTPVQVQLSANTVRDASGTPVAMMTSFVDITEHKAAEEALRASEQRYRKVVEDQTEFICRFFPDGRLTFINEAYCSYFRLNREECIGKRHSIVLPPDDAQQMENHLAALTPENPVALITHRIVMPSGEVRWHHWSDRAIYDTKGDVIEYQSVGRDITRQKEIETQLKNYKETLEQRVRDRTSELSETNLKLKKEIEDRKKNQKKLALSSKEKDLLLREVHHRVKNNLQLIIGLIAMTKTRAHEPIVISTLTDIMAKVQTMGSIHTRLYESKRFDKINMRRQVHDLVEMISGFCDHDHLDITTNIDCVAIYLPVDQAIPCALALNEIISNIHKHAFSGRRSGLVEISSSKRADKLRFIIRDNGIGLPSGFNIEKSNRLGLKLMRMLVEQQLHGNVQITSKAGTEVVIEFPINQEESDYGTGTGS